MIEARIVLTTAGSIEQARKIAHALVDQRLAACVNIIPKIESVYRWHANVETAEEYLLLIKTVPDLFERVRDAIIANHTYELPECMMVHVDHGSADYLKWIAENTV